MTTLSMMLLRCNNATPPPHVAQGNDHRVWPGGVTSSHFASSLLQCNHVSVRNRYVHRLNRYEKFDLAAFVTAISGNRLHVETQHEVLSSQIGVDHNQVIRIWQMWGKRRRRVRVTRRQDSSMGSRDRTANRTNFDALLFLLSSSARAYMGCS